MSSPDISAIAKVVKATPSAVSQSICHRAN